MHLKHNLSLILKKSVYGIWEQKSADQPAYLYMQSSQESLKMCLTESGKMIQLCVKFQDIFTRMDEFLPDLVRQSYAFQED